MRRSLALALILPALALPFAGCSSGGQKPTPLVCVTAPEIWLTALADAPDQVLIEGSTPIGDCLPADQSAAHQEEVGLTAVDTATILASSIKRNGAGREGKARNAGRAALMAGYLIGALESAAGETQGIHDTLVERVKAAATNGLDGAGQAVQGEYQRGYEAGIESGRS